MEIINLKTPEHSDGSFESDKESKELIITDIKQGVKNINRVNIFVNKEYSFSLDLTQVVDFKIKIGKVITEDELESYKKASAFGKMYQRTLEWVLTRPHSVRETHDYLYRKKCEKEDEEKIIERLVSRGYLNDESFAKYYVENRFVKKGISTKRLKMELMKKGIDSSIIEEVLSSGARNDDEEIQKMILKKYKKYDKEKLINYLVRQGFHYQQVQSLVQDFYETDLQNLE